MARKRRTELPTEPLPESDHGALFEEYAERCEEAGDLELAEAFRRQAETQRPR